MTIEAARTFDKDRKFEPFWNAEPVGAARWLAAIMARAEATCELLKDLPQALAANPTPELVAQFEGPAKAAGEVLTKRPQEFQPDALRVLGWNWPETIRPAMLRGAVRLEPTTEDLKKRLVIRVGQVARPLICNDDALESFGGDLSPFEDGYEVALVGWPDDAGQFFVEEAAPIVQHPGLSWFDWGQGRLYDNGDTAGPVVLRVNKDRQIRIDDCHVQEALRPFVGTAVVIYGRRAGEGASAFALTDIAPDFWFLTRLTNPADPAANLPAAPRPMLQAGGALCIGATPPWNWQGPNVETHLLTPAIVASLAGTEERRIVYGRPLGELPAGWINPVASVRRVVDVEMVTERPIDSAAHLATRRAPRGALLKTIRGIAEVVSAEQVFAGLI